MLNSTALSLTLPPQGGGNYRETPQSRRLSGWGIEKLMKLLIITALYTILISLLFSSGFAAGDDVKKGNALFNGPKLGGSSFGVSCRACHPEGKGLEKSFEVKSLEDAINTCIVVHNNGQAIDPKSQKMKDLVEYIKSLGKKPKVGTSLPTPGGK